MGRRIPIPQHLAEAEAMPLGKQKEVSLRAVRKRIANRIQHNQEQIDTALAWDNKAQAILEELIND